MSTNYAWKTKLEMASFVTIQIQVHYTCNAVKGFEMVFPIFQKTLRVFRIQRISFEVFQQKYGVSLRMFV